jgi:hypothetical protein
MRRLISFGLISLFLLTQLGSVIWYYTRPLIHFICNSRQENNLGESSNNHLAILHLSSLKYQTEFKGEDEIRLGGMLYDIISTQSSGDSVVLKLESDLLETSLLAKYDQISENFAQTHPAQKQSDQHLWKWVFQLFNAPPAEKKIIPFFAHSIPGSIRNITSLSAAYLDVPAQPPRQAAC